MPVPGSRVIQALTAAALLAGCGSAAQSVSRTPGEIAQSTDRPPAVDTYSPTQLPSSPRATPTTASRAAVGGTASVAPPAAPAVRRSTSNGKPDPASWSNRQLAGQLTFTCAQMSDAAGIKNAAASGVGGIALFGDPGSGLAKRLAAARRSAPQGVTPFIASDEEGGRVQRLAAAIYPLPSAERMGTWTPTKIQSAAEGYGRRMRTLGVTMSFGPVADLAIPGHYIAELGRGFSREPDKVASAVNAWDEGLRRAGVVAVVKHWPGHGEARNTHTGPATVPSLGTLRRRDMLPFNAAFAAHVPAVMVGHLRVPGLTGPTIPATESPAALRYLRVRAGEATLVITDDLAMAAASTAMGITPSTAAVRALQAGADMALNCQPPFARTVEAIRQAIDNGLVPRPQALASVRRILAVKYANGPATK